MTGSGNRPGREKKKPKTSVKKINPNTPTPATKKAEIKEPVKVQAHVRQRASSRDREKMGNVTILASHPMPEKNPVTILSKHDKPSV